MTPASRVVCCRFTDLELDQLERAVGIMGSRSLAVFVRTAATTWARAISSADLVPGEVVRQVWLEGVLEHLPEAGA